MHQILSELGVELLAGEKAVSAVRVPARWRAAGGLSPSDPPDEIGRPVFSGTLQKRMFEW
jgi:hypothetical protein